MNAHWIKLLPQSIRSRLAGRTALQNIVGNGAWLLSERAVRMAVGLLVAVWMTRYLGPVGFGTISYAMAITALFGSLVTLGIDTTAVRDLVRHPANKAEIIGSVAALRTIGAGLAISASLLTVCTVRPQDSQLIHLVLILSMGYILQGFDAIDLWFQSQVQARFSVLCRLIPFLGFAAVKIYLVLSGASLIQFANAIAAEALATSATFAIVLRGTGHRLTEFLPSGERMRQLMRESWPLLLSGFAIMIYMRIDQIMLAEFSGEREVGLYSAALRLSEVWYVIPVAIVSSVSPALVRARASSEALYYRRIAQLLRFLVRVAVLIAIPMTFLSDELVTAIYGPEFADAWPILAVHVWTAVFVFLGVGTGPWIVNEGAQRFSLFQTLLGALVNVAINLILIPRMGGLGAAIATLISQFMATFVALALWQQARPLFIVQCSALLNFWRFRR